MTSDSPADGSDETDERSGDTDDARTVEGLLRSADVIEPTADGTDVRLTDPFERALSERIAQLRGGNRALRWLATTRGIDSDAITVTETDDQYVVGHDGETIGAWHSEAGFLATIAAEPTIREWIDEERLADLDDEVRAELSARLVMCLERCPSCEESLSFVDRERDDGSPEVVLQCQNCRAVVATAPAVGDDDSV